MFPIPIPELTPGSGLSKRADSSLGLFSWFAIPRLKASSAPYAAQPANKIDSPIARKPRA